MAKRMNIVMILSLMGILIVIIVGIIAFINDKPNEKSICEENVKNFCQTKNFTYITLDYSSGEIYNVVCYDPGKYHHCYSVRNCTVFEEWQSYDNLYKKNC